MPRERVLTVWAGPTEVHRLDASLSDFAARLAAMPAYERLRPLDPEEVAKAVAVAARRAAQ